MSWMLLYLVNWAQLWKGMSPCMSPGVGDCVIWWDAWAAWASISAAIGTWVVGFLAGSIAWITFRNSKKQADLAIRIDQRRDMARHELWLTDLNTALYVKAVVDNYEKTVETVFKDKAYSALADFYRVCQDAVPTESLRPPGYFYSEEDAKELFFVELARQRVRTAAESAIFTLSKDQPSEDTLRADFAIFKDWACSLHRDAKEFIPKARELKPASCSA